MNQAIAGVTPVDEREVQVTTVWPSVAVYGMGRTLGQLYSISWPGVSVFRLGYLIALASIPIALMLYFLRVLPGTGIRYVLTNRRVIVMRGLPATESKAVELDRFDSIEIVTHPGDEWYHSGDLIFRHDGVETFRLEAVSRPEVFRRTCLEAHQAYVGVRAALQRQAS